jgi:WD40 repeat protein
MVQKLNEGKAEGKPLLIEPGASRGRYVASGHLLFMRDATLYGVGFDAGSLNKMGQPIPVLNHVKESGDSSSLIDISADGTLVYLPGDGVEEDRFQLEWVDREGNTTPLPIDPDNYNGLNLSPDGDFLAYNIRDGGQSDISTYHIERHYIDPQTREPGLSFLPLWSPSGESIVFSHIPVETQETALYWKAIGIGGKPQRVTEGTLEQVASSWHPNGRGLIVTERGESGRNVRILELEGNETEGWKAKGEGATFRPTEQDERDGTLSPDGNWVAMSVGRGRNSQIYVFPYKGEGKPVRVSVEGDFSRTPKWLPGDEGKGELVFCTKMNVSQGAVRQIYIATYEVEGGKFNLEEDPIPWEGGTTTGSYGWDIFPDGSKILVCRPTEVTETGPIDSVILFDNFTEHLKKEIPRP